MMIDATKSLEQKRLLEIELDAVGIRLNSHKPDGTSFLSLRWPYGLWVVRGRETDVKVFGMDSRV